MLWLGAICFLLAGASIGFLVGVRYGFADGRRQGRLRGIDDFLGLLDQADRNAWGSNGPPERPEVTD